MIQELVQNVLKHACATHVLIQLIFRDDLLSITVEDNGNGCAMDRINSKVGGLSSITKRVKAMSGLLEI
jgi:signal transduction histidine kinase